MSKDITLGNQNPVTGAWNWVWDPDTGDVAFDDTEAHSVVTSVMERRGSYWANRAHGSDLYKLRSLTTRTPSQAEAEALASVKPLEDAGLIQLARAEAAVDKRGGGIGRLQLDVSWKSGTGERTNQIVEV